MNNERYKQIMKNLGMENSSSLLSALQQVANEVAQERNSVYETKVFAVVEALKCIANNTDFSPNDMHAKAEEALSLLRI